MDITRILVPSDLSKPAETALRYAHLFVDRFAAKLTVMYADPLLYPLDVFGGDLVIDAEKQGISEGTLEECLRRHVVAQIGPEVPFETRLSVGPAVPMIVKAADETGADLIIIGTRGHHGWRRAIVGSITSGILHATERPVLVVKSDPVVSVPRITRILCPINMSEVAREALGAAEVLASRFGAELVLVHVNEEGRASGDAELAMRQWLGVKSGPASPSWRELVVRGGAAERVLDCAEDLRADLIVIGAQHRRFGGEDTVIGTTTERLLRFAACPVFTVIRKAEPAARREPVTMEAESLV